MYGEEGTIYTVYLLPNIIMVLTYTVAVALTTITFISERKQGIYDRFIISGVTEMQILLSHVLLNFFVLVIQIGSMLVIPVLVFGFEYQGSIVLLMALAILQGYVGMTFGKNSPVGFIKVSSIIAPKTQPTNFSPRERILVAERTS